MTYLHRRLSTLLLPFVVGACSSSEADPGGTKGSGGGAETDELGSGGNEGSDRGSGGAADPSGDDGGSGGASPEGGSPGEGSGGAGESSSGGNTGEGSGGALPPIDDTPIERPPLITSAEGAYWQPGELTPGGSEATISVDTFTAYQTWFGFSGMFNESGWEYMKELSDVDKDAVLDLLFNPRAGIGFDWAGIPMGAGEHSLERYSLSDAPGQFDVSHDQETLIPYARAALAKNGNIKFWARPASPPPWAKTGETYNGGIDAGEFDPAQSEAYADYFVDWIQAYEAEGLPIDSVMPQNEPGFVGSIPTCAFGPTQDLLSSGEVTGPSTLGAFVDAHLFPALESAGLQTKLWAGAFSNDDTFDAYYGDLLEQPSADRLAGVGLTGWTLGRVAELSSQGLLIMQTAQFPGNRPFLYQATSLEDADRDNFLPYMAPNNHAYGEESWDMIKDWIDSGANIYGAPNLVLDTIGYNLDEYRPWPQNALIAIDREAGTMRATAAYYVFRHIAQYVAPGAQRIDVTGDALAFKNEDGSVTTIIFNEETTPVVMTLAVDEQLVSFEIPARGWATVNL